MNTFKYQSLVTQNLQASASKLKMKINFTFHHDKDSKHTSNKTMTSPEEDLSIGMANEQIRAKGLNHLHFQAFLEETHSEFGDVTYHTETQWQSRGKSAQQVFELCDEI